MMPVHVLGDRVARPRGVCPLCTRSVALKSDGTLWVHQSLELDPNQPRVHRHCHGTGHTIESLAHE